MDGPSFKAGKNPILVDVLSEESSGEELDSHDVDKASNAGLAGHPVKKRHRKMTSKVWEYFELLDQKDDKGNFMCKCLKCGIVYNAESKQGTGNLKRHIEKCKKFKDIGQMFLDTSSSGSLRSRLPVFDPEVFRGLCAVAIVKHDLPFSFVEYEAVRRCFSYLNPEAKLVTRNTLKADILSMFSKEKVSLKEELSVVRGRISLTSDCWTSITTDGYISLTAHYVDNDWVLQKKILNFCFIPPPHTGNNMSVQISGLLKDWGIHKKIMSITLDNASANDVYANLLMKEMKELVCSGEFFHVRCCAHILNLVVQDGLKEIDDAVGKVRDSVKYCKGSQGRKQRFLSSVAHVELDCTRGLKQDVPTRWNSTYLMLESVLYYKKAFINMQRCDANYVHCPNDDEWERIEKIFKFLKVFYDVTKVFSGTRYPTANLYFPNVLKVRLLLKREMESADMFMQKMAKTMFEKFSKYWANFSTVMAVAVVLDPRFKLEFVEWAFKKVYGILDGEIELSKFKEKFWNLYDFYKAQSVQANSAHHSHVASAQQDGDPLANASDELMEDFDNFSSEKSDDNSETDLEVYLREKLLPRATKIDILYHWKTSMERFPVLSLMAKDILAIPISTVASESAFSVGGRILDCYRSSLKPSTAEALVCLKDWTFGEAKMNPQLEDLCGQVMDLKLDNEAPIQSETGHE